MISSSSVEKLWFIASLEDSIVKMGLSERFADLITLGAALLLLFFFILILDFLLSKLLVNFIERVVRRSTIKWDDKLADFHFFRLASRFLIAVLMINIIDILLVGYDSHIVTLAVIVCKIVALLYITKVIFSLIDVVHSLYNTRTIAKQKSVKGYVQTIKILVAVAAIISAIMVIFNLSIGVFFTSIAASAAVITLIFKDAILGLISSIQLSSLDLVRLGDWIEIPSKGANGVVIDLSLTTVKVQNWNKSVVVIPIYSLSTESFVNWRNMTEGDGRQFQRNFYIDVTTISPLSQELIHTISSSKIAGQFMADFLNSHKDFIACSTTNLALFRAYITHYLDVNPNVNQDLTHFVHFRQLEDKGLPFAIYGFTKTTDWIEHETQVCEVVEHILALATLFDFKLFQRTTSQLEITKENC